MIRHRLKIQATITNAQVFQEIQAEFGSFDRYLWNFVDQQPIVNHWRHRRGSSLHGIIATD